MAEILGGVLLAMYSFAGQATIPLVPVILDRRAKRGLEDRSRRDERYGLASSKPPHPNVLWVHAASVGETSSVLPLIGRLAAEGWFVVLTTITVTGAATAARNPPEGVLHQFAPVDIKPWVKRFLDHWRPRAALFVESEVWPLMTDQLSRRSIPHIIVNARMSDRSYKRWRMFGSAPRRIFGRIGMALAQTDADAGRLQRLGVRSAKAVGNLKLDAPHLAFDEVALEEFRRDLGNRPIWVAASTHAGEEAAIGACHASLAERFPELVTILVPRHPGRGAEIAELLAADGLAFRLRSREPGLFAGGGILIADTLGELGLFYRLAEIAFLGGSLVDCGGHNPIEPVALGASVLHGPHVGNFAPIFGALQAGGGSTLVADSAELAEAVAGFFDNPERRLATARAAENALLPFRGALARTLVELEPFLGQPPVAHT